MTAQQNKRLEQLREYAQKQRDACGYGRLEVDKENADKWTNVLAWLLLIEDDQ